MILLVRHRRRYLRPGNSIVPRSSMGRGNGSFMETGHSIFFESHWHYRWDLSVSNIYILWFYWLKLIPLVDRSSKVDLLYFILNWYVFIENNYQFSRSLKRFNRNTLSYTSILTNPLLLSTSILPPHLFLQNLIGSFII